VDANGYEVKPFVQDGTTYIPLRGASDCTRVVRRAATIDKVARHRARHESRGKIIDMTHLWKGDE
jgi:hypothetical protein